MLYTKIQFQSVLSSGEGLCFSPYMGMAAILLNGVEPYKQIVNILVDFVNVVSGLCQVNVTKI